VIELTHMQNIITVDVEDYFHPSEVQRSVLTTDWDALPSRVCESTDRVLDLFAKHRITGTFFVLGWVANRHPALLRRIASFGHQLGNHSFYHRLVYSLTPAEFRTDTMQAQDSIANASGVMPTAYRAPSYSITSQSLWALEILVQAGITHDSSIYPISHDRYGIPGFKRFATLMQTPSGPIMEIPIATSQVPGHRWLTPVGGGAYLRLLPYRYTAAGLRSINEDDSQPACVYFHPWELDPEQPRIAKGWLSRMRTYLGQNTMERKIDRLFSEFSFGSLNSVLPWTAAGHRETLCERAV
jgi:polysaccharide deacetylase family protein (PEP-CTERM system associated)